jgi:ubiquitin C-terminal hydrolase
LRNEGSTCYLNAMCQTLFVIPLFREVWLIN